MGKVIYLEICNFKLDHANRCYMHNPESVLQNETHDLLLYFEIHLISARRPDLMIDKKKREPAEQWTLSSGLSPG